ncbi:PAS domain S-box protein [Belliella sp. DSM 107340]|uniref:histidine kinase n=1 Tax=Belliella calami TaxID=2923436 RepID=A0ABS9UM94_9BACT|nr:PAS domain S-box protein [Belliella calami]MCH7397663.1 PAS domain S-box protein [Belliella calami]
MSELSKHNFQNILFTLKKYKNQTFELLYISSEVRELIRVDSKFYKESFFEALFPTIKKPVFEFFFKSLGNGDKFICPIVFKDNCFQWVQIEGYVISQEDGSYLINALVSPIQIPNNIKYSWLLVEGHRYAIQSNDLGTVGFESWEQMVKFRFSFLGEKEVSKFKKNKHPSFLTIFPGRLFLTKKLLCENIELIQLEYHTSKSALEAGLLQENPSEASNDNLIYYEYNTETDEMRFSGAVKKVLGYDNDFFEGISKSKWREHIHPDDKLVYNRGFKHTNTIVYKYLHANGQYIFLQDEKRTISNEDSTGEIVLGIIADISEFKEIEKELLDNKNILDELTGVVPGIVYMLKAFPDGTHQYIFISEGCMDLVELHPYEMLQNEDSFQRLILEEDLDSFLSASRKSFDKNQKFESEFRIKTKSGKTKWIFGASNRLKKFQDESIWAGLYVDITHRKLKEEEHTINLIKYKTLFDENPVSIFNYSKDGEILAANKSYLEHVGLESENEIIGKNLFEIAKGQPIIQVFKDSLVNGLGKYEGPYVTFFTNRLYHLRVNAKAIDNGDNYQAILEDISEQEYVHNVLSELTERTSKYSGQKFFDELTLLLSEKLNMDYCFIAEINSKDKTAKTISIHHNGVKIEDITYEIANSPCEQAMATNSPLIILQDAQKHFPYDEDLKKLNISSYMGVSLTDINNNKLGMLVLMGSMQMYVSSAYENVLSVLSDRIGAEISRISYEKRLLASEQLFRNIAENFPKGVIEVLDTNFKYVYTDGKEYRQRGIDPSYLIGSSLFEKYDYEISKQVVEQLTKVLMGESVAFELVIGNQHYLSNGVPLINNRGEIDRILLVTQNITESKNAEEERTLLIKDLKSQNEELQRFAYIISHNLRAPIVNITSLLELYNNQDASDPDNKEIIDNLRVATNILNNTLQDLIDVVAIKKNKLPKIELVNFDHIIGNLEKSLSKQIEEADAVIHKDFSGAVKINYIYSHLENFLINLTTNAIKYRHPDRKLQINIKTFTQGAYTVIEFKDNGIGIDLDRYRDRLFGLYQRFHSHVEGKGLGLYLVREQIRAHDGNLHVESEVGKGTTFYIHLKNLIVNTEEIF